MAVTHIQIDTISLIPELQHRPRESEKVKEYADLITAGVKLPPVFVVFDGREFLLVDGFHRLAAHEQAGIKEIAANIVNATRLDAIWASFSANTKHGVPLTREQKREVIQKIINDPQWNTKTDEQIATHVGVSSRFVRGVRAEDTNEDTEHPITGTVPVMGTDDSTNEESESSLSDKKSTKGTKKTAPKEEQPKLPTTDFAGHTLPKDIAEPFARIDAAKSFMHDLSVIRNTIDNAIAAGDMLWIHLPRSQFNADMKNAYAAIKFAIPHSVCPYCKGRTFKTCKACSGAGWMPKEMYERVPEEIRGK
jgi:hypothetical protein